jgi:hypothetical protein
VLTVAALPLSVWESHEKLIGRSARAAQSRTVILRNNPYWTDLDQSACRRCSPEPPRGAIRGTALSAGDLFDGDLAVPGFTSTAMRYPLNDAASHAAAVAEGGA